MRYLPHIDHMPNCLQFQQNNCIYYVFYYIMCVCVIVNCCALHLIATYCDSSALRGKLCELRLLSSSRMTKSDTDLISNSNNNKRKAFPTRLEQLPGGKFDNNVKLIPLSPLRIPKLTSSQRGSNINLHKLIINLCFNQRIVERQHAQHDTLSN